jgi:hypothetical protein
LCSVVSASAHTSKLSGFSVGCELGYVDGSELGSADGSGLGSVVGCELGSVDGSELGSADGCGLGSVDGSELGSANGSWCMLMAALVGVAGLVFSVESLEASRVGRVSVDSSWRDLQ